LDVIVAADLQAQHAVHLVATRGEENNRCARHCRRLADLPAKLESVYVRQHHVQHDQVRLGALQLVERSLIATQDLGLVAVPGQVVIDQGG